MDITDASAVPPVVPTPTTQVDDGASSSQPASSSAPPDEVPPDPQVNEHPHEVSNVSDLHIVREVVLGPDDCPSVLSDDSSVPDDDSDASSIASSAAAMEDVEPELPPPAEDHSVQQLAIHTDAVFAVCVNAAVPEILATGGGDDVGYLWRVGQPTPLCKLEGHADTISALGFSADGTLLASAGLDGTVRVWSAESGALVAALEGPSQGVTWLCWHTRGQVLLAGSEDATAWMWKLPEGNVMQIFSAHSANVSYGAFINNGRAVLTASEDGTVRVWNPRTGTVDFCLQAGALGQETRPVTSLAAHPSQPVFMFGIDDGGLKVSRLHPLERPLPPPCPPPCPARQPARLSSARPPGPRARAPVLVSSRLRACVYACVCALACLVAKHRRRAARAC